MNDDENLKAEVLENQNMEETKNINNKGDESTENENIKTTAVALENKEKIDEKEVKEEKNESNFDEKVKEKSNINIKETIKEKNKIEKTIRKNEKKEKKNSSSKKGFKIITILFALIVIILLAFSTVFALINSNNNTILSGISIRNILVEGLTEEQATKIISEKCEEEKSKEIVLKINGETYSITPEQIGIEYGIEKAVNSAYQIGRDGNIFKNNFEILFSMIENKNIDMEVTCNEELLKNVLNDFNAKLANAMVDNTYCIEENKLIITRGTAGIVVDIENAKQQIINNIKQGNYEEIEINTKYVECPVIDIDKIYAEVKCEPQNATYKKDPFEVIPHKNGIDFDLEEARKVLSEEKEEYVIDLIITEPEIHTNEFGEEAFPDLISSFSTKYDETNVPRSKNLKIAMS